MLTNHRVEKIQCHQIHSILQQPPTVELEGKEVPDFQTKLNLKNLRFIQTDLVYLFGLPPELCDFTALSSMVYLGQYGELKEVQNVRLGGEGQGSSIYVRFEDSFQASLAILSLSLYSKKYQIPRAVFGSVKYCPSFLSGRKCNNRQCQLSHSKIIKGHYFYKEKKDVLKSHFEIICAVLRDNKEKMRKIFNSIKEGKRMKNAIFPTVEETIEFYGVEETLEKLWKCEEYIEGIESEFKKEENVDEYDELWQDIKNIEKNEKCEDLQSEDFEEYLRYRKKVYPGFDFDWNFLGLSGFGFFSFVDDYSFVKKYNKTFLKRKRKIIRPRSRSFYYYKGKLKSEIFSAKKIEGNESEKVDTPPELNLIEQLAQPLAPDVSKRKSQNEKIVSEKNQQKLKKENELLKDLNFGMIPTKNEEMKLVKEEVEEITKEVKIQQDKEKHNDIHEISTRSNGISNSNLRSSTVTSVKKIEVKFDENTFIFSTKAQNKKRKKAKKKRRKKKQKKKVEEENQRLYKTEEALSDIKREEVFSEEHKSIGGGSSPHECDPLEDRNSLKSLRNDQKETQQLQSASSEKMKSKSKKGVTQSEKYKKNEILRKVEDVQTKPFFSKNNEEKKEEIPKKEEKKIEVKKKEKKKTKEENLKYQEEIYVEEEEEDILTYEIIEYYRDIHIKEADDLELWLKVQYSLIDPDKSKSIRKKKRKKLRKLMNKEKKRRLENPGNKKETYQEDTIDEENIEKTNKKSKSKKKKKVQFKNSKETYFDPQFEILYEQDEDTSGNLPIDLIYTKATKKIIASEYELDKFKEIRNIAEVIFRDIKDKKSAYETICQMLRKYPEELKTKKPIFFERTEEVTKIIYPVENTTLMPDEKEYPF